MNEFWLKHLAEFQKKEHDEFRRKQIESLAKAIYDAVRETNPGVCCYTSGPEFINGKWEGLDEVGFDGTFDLLKLADALFGRIS